MASGVRRTLDQEARAAVGQELGGNCGVMKAMTAVRRTLRTLSFTGGRAQSAISAVILVLGLCPDEKALSSVVRRQGSECN